VTFVDDVVVVSTRRTAFNCKSPIDDAEHAIFHCDRWWYSRRALEVDIGWPFKRVDATIHNKDIWIAVTKFVDIVMTKIKEEDRIRQQEEASI